MVRFHPSAQAGLPRIKFYFSAGSDPCRRHLIMVKDFTKKHSKKFFAILTIGVILGAGAYIYFSLQPAKAYSFYAPLANNLAQKAEEIKDAINKSEPVKKIKEKTSEIQESAAEVAENFKNSAFASVKENMNKGLDAVGSAIGAEQIKKNQEQNNKEQCK